MSKKLTFALLLILASLMFAGISAAQGNGNGGDSGNGNGSGRDNRQTNRGGGQNGCVAGQNCPANTAAEDLPEDVIAAMIDGLNDERTAAAVYAAVIDQFGAVRPFTSILRAEERHQAAWERMFTRYGIALPPMPDITLPEFETLAEACEAGVQAEIANRTLYDNMLATFEGYPDLTRVAEMLRAASNISHLPAFQRCAG